MPNKKIYLLGQNVCVHQILNSKINEHPDNVVVSIYPSIQQKLWQRGFETISFFQFMEELSSGWRIEFDEAINRVDGLIYNWLERRFGSETIYRNLAYYFCRFYYIYFGIFQLFSAASKTEGFSKVVVLEGRPIRFAGFNRVLWSLHEDLIVSLSTIFPDKRIEIEFQEMSSVESTFRQCGIIGRFFLKNVFKNLVVRMWLPFRGRQQLLVVSAEHQFPEKIQNGLAEGIEIFRSSSIGFDISSLYSSYKAFIGEKIELDIAGFCDSDISDVCWFVERIFGRFIVDEGFWGLVELRSKRSWFREMCLEFNPECCVISNSLGDSAVVCSVLIELGKPVLAVSHGSYSISNCQRANVEWFRHAKSMIPVGGTVEVGVQSLLAESFFNEFPPDDARLIPILPFGFGQSISEAPRNEENYDRSDNEDPIILLLAPSFRSLVDYRPFVYQSEEEWAHNLSVILEETGVANNTQVWISLRGGDRDFFVNKFRLTDLISNVKFLEPGEFRARIDQCDYVISDSSTAIEDALCRKKRIILTPFVNGYQHISDRGLLYPQCGSNSVTICKDEKALRGALKRLVKTDLAGDTNYSLWITGKAQMSVNDWVALNVKK